MGELKDSLFSITENLNIGILDGNKVLEAKDTSVNKGRAASEWLRYKEYDFIFGVGDDYTDEDLFEVLPEEAYSVKVGMALSRAKYHIRDWQSLRGLLDRLCYRRDALLAAILQTTSKALRVAPGSAVPVPALSKAVPWAGVVIGTGKPAW